ncbi:MAG: VWA domain-containing protein, partial [Pseudomonadota bacterium]
MWTESRQSGMDMVVAVDVSRSMLAQDLDPSRLEQARRMIVDLLDVAAGDRIGLVVFAGAAFVQCPLTVDHGAVRSF